jgi:acyl carrier protein
MADKKAELLRLFSEALEQEVDENTVLEGLETWDSMAVVLFVAAIDDTCGGEILGDQVGQCKTVADVLRLAGVRP